VILEKLIKQKTNFRLKGQAEKWHLRKMIFQNMQLIIVLPSVDDWQC